MSKIRLEPFTNTTLQDIWKAGFTEDKPAWKAWDGPYFTDDYEPYSTFEAFKQALSNFFLSEACRCIKVDDKTVGMVSRYWQDRHTLWLSIGITLYSPEAWGGGIGTEALALWITQTFTDFPELEHIGLTTWSGNYRMMRVAEKLGMQKEAQIRKVRYWNNIYYDSVSYGVLREEWGE